MGFFYLATPYAKYPGGTEVAYRAAVLNAALLVSNGISVFCPIAHSHPLAQTHHAWPEDPEAAYRFWLDFDKPFMAAAKGLIVCQLPGWDTSRGIDEEITAFVLMDKPIIYMEPGRVPPNLQTPSGEKCEVPDEEELSRAGHGAAGYGEHTRRKWE